MSARHDSRLWVGGQWPRAPPIRLTSSLSYFTRFVNSLQVGEKGRVTSMQLVNIEAIRERIARNEEERVVLDDLLHDAERLQQFDGVQQPTLDVGPRVIANEPKGSVSYPEGLRLALQQAQGRPMKAAEVWAEMEKLGVRSDAKRPQSYVSLNVKKFPDEIESMGNGTFRWIGQELPLPRQELPPGRDTMDS